MVVSQAETAAATAALSLSEWVPGTRTTVRFEPVGGVPNGSLLALHDEGRDIDGVELREAALLGAAGRVEGEREADEGDRLGVGGRAARDAGAGGAAAGQDREAAEWALVELEDDRRPSRVELARRSGAAPSCYPVGLLDERDAEPRGMGALGGRDEIGRLDPAAGAMAENECRDRRVHRTQVRSGPSVRSVELEHPTSLALGSGSLVHDEDGALRVATTAAATLPLQVSREPAPAVRAEHDQARVVLLGGLDDALPGRRGLDGHALRAEPGLLGQRGSVRSGLFRGLLHLGRLSASKCCLSTGMNPTSTGCQTQTTRASRPGASCPPACSIAKLRRARSRRRRRGRVRGPGLR